MNMKLKKILDDIQKTEDKIAELQEHLKRQNTLKQQMQLFLLVFQKLLIFHLT